MSEWLKEADCKSARYAYAGSNPARPNSLLYFSCTIENTLLKNILSIQKKAHCVSIKHNGLFLFNPFINYLNGTDGTRTRNFRRDRAVL